MHIRRTIGAGIFVSLIVVATGIVRTQSTPQGEWRYFGGDKGYTRYSPLDQINSDNVGEAEDSLAAARRSTRSSPRRFRT